METCTGMAERVAWVIVSLPAMFSIPAFHVGMRLTTAVIYQLLLLRALQPYHQKWCSQITVREWRHLTGKHLLHQSDLVLSTTYGGEEAFVDIRD
jgi:hypothetical protein